MSTTIKRGRNVSRIVTGDKTYIKFMNVEQGTDYTKNTQSFTKWAQKFKQTPLKQKIMATVFWDCKAI